MPRLFSRAKVARHLFLTEGAFATIASFAAIRGPNEIGGAAVGYVSTDNALVVTDVCGPGPRGVCTPDRVTIDGRYATAFCERHRVASDGSIQYLGDWHVHTGDSCSPSPIDFEAIRKLPRRNAWGYPTVSLILNASLTTYACLTASDTSLDCSILGT